MLFWKAFYRYCHHIRVFETNDPNFSFFAVHHLSRLQSVTYCPIVEFELSKVMLFEGLGHGYILTPDRQEEIKTLDNRMAVRTFITNNKETLRTLSIDEECFLSKAGEDVFHDVLAPSLLTTLEKLEISFDEANEPLYDDDDYEDMLPHIFDEYVEENEGVDFVFSKTLKEVVIHGGDAEIDPIRLLFLRQCDKLDTIRLDQLDLWAMISIPLALQRFCPNLVHLDWRKGNHRPASDTSLAMLLSSTIAGWRVLELPEMQHFGPIAFETFNRKAVETIEVLCVDGWGKLGVEEFLEILCSAKRLRRLEGAPQERMSATTKVFVVDTNKAYIRHQEQEKESGGSPCFWALGSSMEFLQLKITGVPRLDVIYDQDGGVLVKQFAEPSLARQYDVQRWIYTQLGRMTGLKELLLGTKKYNYASLEFSLESGLELLAGLKELRVLDVSMMAHRIGVKELDWMRITWPKLKEIRGLKNERKWADQGGSDNGAKVVEEVEGWLADHPFGIGSFFHT
ncbi:hypothetical protein EC991_007962 [Linnemannia zychae]|nr:hypothetical protein EC991_007962 [Linnemannia zychae]